MLLILNGLTYFWNRLQIFLCESFLWFQVLTAPLFDNEAVTENDEVEVLVKLLEGVNSSNLLDQQTLLINEEAVFTFGPIKSNSENLTIEVSFILDFPCEIDGPF